VVEIHTTSVAERSGFSSRPRSSSPQRRSGPRRPEGPVSASSRGASISAGSSPGGHCGRSSASATSATRRSSSAGSPDPAAAPGRSSRTRPWSRVGRLRCASGSRRRGLRVPSSSAWWCDPMTRRPRSWSSFCVRPSSRRRPGNGTLAKPCLPDGGWCAGGAPEKRCGAASRLGGRGPRGGRSCTSKLPLGALEARTTAYLTRLPGPAAPRESSTPPQTGWPPSPHTEGSAGFEHCAADLVAASAQRSKECRRLQ
jgi:hypothetical protein